MKKVFSCGHKGKGQFCHRCAAEEQAAQRRRQADDARQAQKANRQALRQDLPADTRGIPHDIVERAHEVWSALQSPDADIGLLQGKPLSTVNRNVYSFPLGRKWRMLCHKDAQGLHLLEILSHEGYNRRFVEARHYRGG